MAMISRNTIIPHNHLQVKWSKSVVEKEAFIQVEEMQLEGGYPTAKAVLSIETQHFLKKT